MADRWMDERDRRWRDRDWRRSEDYRGERGEGRYLADEDRTWGGPGEDERGPYGERRGGEPRDRVFGERETGMGYGGEFGRSGGGAYGGSGAYGEGAGRSEPYGRGESRYGGRGSAYRGGAYGQGGGQSSGWQDRDYGGVSPAMQQGEYDAEREAERFGQPGGYGQTRDYRQGASYAEGGRYYGDAGAARDRIYREEYGQGGVEYGAMPRGYDAERERRIGQAGGRFEGGYDRGAFTGSGMASGGTGGYDYERGYGDAGRQRYSGGRFGVPRDEGRFQPRERGERGERWERGGREAGDFFRRAGERVASWFGGGEHEREEARRDERGFRGMGPKGYKRADDRISDEVHERLTEDPWVDASNISVSVSAGEVTLSGTVENREAKHRAERVVEDVPGVNHVQNNLRVEKGNPLTTPGSGYGDSVLEHQMREETGAGEKLGGSALAGSGSSATGGTSGAASSTRTSGSTGDAGKSR